MADGAVTNNMEKARDGEIWKGPRSQALKHESLFRRRFVRSEQPSSLGYSGRITG